MQQHLVEAGLTTPDEAATEGVCMAVHGYLRAIGHRRLYNRQEVINRLHSCLANGSSTDDFIQKYLRLVYQLLYSVVLKLKFFSLKKMKKCHIEISELKS
jgi:hypothetical protein